MRPRKVTVHTLDEISISAEDRETPRGLAWQTTRRGSINNASECFSVSPESGLACDGRTYALTRHDVAFTTQNPLGQGSFGSVWQGCIKSLNRLVAIKTVRVGASDEKQVLLREIRGLINAEGCPYLITWYGGFVSKAGDTVHIVMELMDLGSLDDLKKALDGTRAPAPHLACITVQVLRGLNHLHNVCNIMHRDVKPENILANSEGEVKLADFGVCWHKQNCAELSSPLRMAETPVGTRRYMSPERCAMQSYSFVADVWSVGVVVFDLAAGWHPFGHVKTVLELHDELSEKEPPQLDTELHEPDLVDFVTLCLKKDASQRPIASALLEHKFVANGLERRNHLGAWIMQVRNKTGDGTGLMDIPCLHKLQESAACQAAKLGKSLEDSSFVAIDLNQELPSVK